MDAVGAGMTGVADKDGVAPMLEFCDPLGFSMRSNRAASIAA